MCTSWYSGLLLVTDLCDILSMFNFFSVTDVELPCSVYLYDQVSKRLHDISDIDPRMLSVRPIAV